jgi:hypothetical protein
MNGNLVARSNAVSAAGDRVNGAADVQDQSLIYSFILV